MLSQCLLGIVVPDKQTQFRDPNCTHIPQPHPQFFLQSLYIPDIGQLLKSHNENLEESHSIVQSFTGSSQSGQYLDSCGEEGQVWIPAFEGRGLVPGFLGMREEG